LINNSLSMYYIFSGSAFDGSILWSESSTVMI
jgi:hypothetical protein